MSQTASIQETVHEALGIGGIEQARAEAELAGGRQFDALINSRAGRAFTKLVVAANLAGAAAPVAAVATEGGHSTTTVVNTETGVTTRGSHAWQKDGDFAKVTVMGNHRVVAKAEVEEAREEGNCFWVNGKKEEVYVEGITASGVGMGRDTRKSEFCKVDVDANGDGKVDDKDVVRAKCGNFAIIGSRPEGAIDQVIWAEGKARIPVKASSKVTAEAECTTTDGLASAKVSGEGEASASGFIKLKGGGRTMIKKAQNKVNSIINQSISGKGMAKSKAFIVVDAQCTESNAPSVPPKPPTPGNNPPTVDLIGPQHVLTNGIVDVCAYGSDPNNDIVSRTFSETGNGNFISPVYSGDEPGEFCQTYKAGTEADNATITATVVDSANQSDSDSESFPIVGSEDPRGQF